MLGSLRQAPMKLGDQQSNLLFLLGIASLAAAGCDPGEGDTTTTTNPTTTGPDPTTSTTDPPTTSATGDSGQMTMTGDGSTDDGPPPTTDTSTTDPSDTTSGEECMGPPPKVDMIGEACRDYTNFFNDCYYKGGLSEYCLEVYGALCQYYTNASIEMYGEACGDAISAYLSCVAGLTCEEFADEIPDCVKEDAAIIANCAAAIGNDPIRPIQRMRRR